MSMSGNLIHSALLSNHIILNLSPGIAEEDFFGDAIVANHWSFSIYVMSLIEN